MSGGDRKVSIRTTLATWLTRAQDTAGNGACRDGISETSAAKKRRTPMNVETVRDRQDVAGRRLIAGVSVPDGPLITAAINYAQRLSEPYLFNHAMRSWLFAEAIGPTRGTDYDHEVVAVGTVLHNNVLTGGRLR